MNQIQLKAKLRKKHRKYNYYWPLCLHALGRTLLLGGRWCEGTEKR
jgi:hypothetical protein